MNENPIEIIPVGALRGRAQALRDQGCRLVQISATRLPDQVELTYSFDLGLALSNLRINLAGPEPRLPSISGIFGCAVLYENEIHDLFGVPVDDLALDFKGNFYKTAVKFPFGGTTPPTPAAARSTAQTHD